jgi:hypothetical protein
MLRAWRRRMRRGVMWSVVLVLFGGMTIGIEGSGPDFPQVRSTTPAIASLLAEAESRSATFRDLVRTIEATDGIVYVEPGECRHGVRACLSLSVVRSGGYRFLRILVDSAQEIVQLMATIGHELRHAIELLSEPAIKTTVAAYNYYLREAPTARGVFETTAAIQTGITVANELSRSHR